MDKVPNSLVRISPHPFGNEWLDSIFAAPKKALEPLLWAKVKEQQARKPESVCQNSDKQTPADTRAELALALEQVFTDKAALNLATSTGGANPRPCQKSDKAAIDTKRELAKVANVSHDTIHKPVTLQPAPAGMCVVCWNYWAKELWAGHCVCTGDVAVRPGGPKLPSNPQQANATA